MNDNGLSTIPTDEGSDDSVKALAISSIICEANVELTCYLTIRYLRAVRKDLHFSNVGDLVLSVFDAITKLMLAKVIVNGS